MAGSTPSTAMVANKRQFSRSRVSRGSVCRTLTIMVLSMTTP
jgi:hypothetical protein